MQYVQYAIYMEYAICARVPVCGVPQAYIWCNHPPTNQPPAFPKPGKITVVSFLQTFLPIFGLYCLCLDVCDLPFF